jgi:DNA-binding beta-propeller fold protein YncE
MSRLRSRRRIVVAVLAVGIMIPASAIAVTTGGLTSTGCIAKSGSSATGCTATGGGALGAPDGVAVSPDGKNVYVVAYHDNAISVFSRAANGALTGTGCIAKSGSSATGCTATGGGALGVPRAVAVSPDGKNVYAVSAADSSISVFARAANGDLTGTGCIAQSGSMATGCTATGGGALGVVSDLAISPDGKNVYTVSLADGAISVFARAANGDLTGTGCIAAPGSPATGCTTTGGGALLGAVGVAVSPDGKSVYVTAETSNAISVFSRASNGDLTGTGCIAKAGSDATGCTATGGDALHNAHAVAVSPDGKDVYVTAETSNAISVFSRAANGDLTGIGCIAKPGSPVAGCAATGGGALGEANSLALSPDGSSVYVTGSADGALSVFSRAANGDLTGTGCFTKSGSTATGCTGSDGGALKGADAVATSPDGASVYAVGFGADAIEVFSRHVSAATLLTTHATKKSKVGKQISDAAHLAGGAAPGGTITFKAYAPSDVSCAKTPAFVSAGINVSGDGGYSSAAFSPKKPGLYRWIATYSGDADNNAAAASCNALHETSLVKPKAKHHHHHHHHHQPPTPPSPPSLGRPRSA